jgi:hypothetical protein
MPQSKIDDAREKTLLKQITKVEVRTCEFHAFKNKADSQKGRRGADHLAHQIGIRDRI